MLQELPRHPVVATAVRALFYIWPSIAAGPFIIPNTEYSTLKMVNTSSSRPHVVVFPFMAQGHMIPLLGIAKMTADRGVMVTVVTTPANARCFRNQMEEATRGLPLDIRVAELEMGVVEGLPEGCENADSLPTMDLFSAFLMASAKLQGQFEHLLDRLFSDGIEPPTCMITDFFLGWTQDAATRWEIPRIVFHGMSAFGISVSYPLWLDSPHRNLQSDEETFLVPNMPVPLLLRKGDLSNPLKDANDSDPVFTFIRRQIHRDMESWGLIVNTFYELEPVYVDHLQNFKGKSALWTIGPVSLCNEKETQRGKLSAIEETECLQWLDSQSARSVIYVSFGSLSRVSDNQMFEIALALEASERPFIWVIRASNICSDDQRALNTNDTESNDNSDFFPEGFEERTKKRGLIIRGWAPQLLILSHPSTGGFVTHCGWNSTLESISAGVPMITWPMFAEQCLNAKMVVEYLRIGLPVRSNDQKGCAELVGWGSIQRVVMELMVGEEGRAARCRAMELGKAAKRAVEEGGSSYKSMDAFVEQLHAMQMHR